MQRQPRVKSVDRTQPMEMNEMYEEVCLPTNRAGGRANPNPYQGVEQNIVSDTPAAVTNTKPKKNKATGYFIVGTLFLSLLALSLIAVVIYSAQTRTVSQDNVASLQAEVQQLKRQLEKLQVIQGTNFTVDQLTSMQNKLEQLTNFETSATSQLISVQSLVQTLSRVQTNTVDELSALHTVNLYQNCIEETRSCDISVSSSASYWRSCGTSGLRINRTVSVLAVCICNAIKSLHHQYCESYYGSLSNL